MQKLRIFRADFPIVPVGAVVAARGIGNAVFLYFSAQRAEYNHFLHLTFYFLLQTLPPVESATPFSLTFPHNVRNTIAASPRANG